ncbi:uncharacterized protein LOC106024897 [Esox lucius]|uniref:uncharacterized protein LOC106024897 n=1 Tax=Esox lucius TaxID=8010 RepID=UPI0014777EFC|nr:uncharacterized protein LOC106024897 [Esox lucius]
MTSDCNYDLGSVEWLEPAWHTALGVLEISVNTDNGPDLAVADSNQVSPIPGALPAVDSTGASRSQVKQDRSQRAGDGQRRVARLSTRDCVTTEERNAVSSEDTLRFDRVNSLHVDNHVNRPSVDFCGDPWSTPDQSTSSVSQTTENAVDPSVSGSTQPFISEALEDNLDPDTDEKPLNSKDHGVSCDIDELLSSLQLGITVACQEDQTLEADCEGDGIALLGHSGHNRHRCESVVRPRGKVQDITQQCSYETDDSRGYAQDLCMYDYKLNRDQTSAWASVPHYNLTRGERVDKNMEGRKNGEEGCDTSSSLCGMNSLSEHTRQWRTIKEVEAEIVPKPYLRDLVMYNGFNQLDDERVGNQLILSSLSRILNDLKEDMAYWKSLGKRESQLMRENERMERRLNEKELRDFTGAEEREFISGKGWRTEREQEECDVAKCKSSLAGVESPIIGLHPSSHSPPLPKELSSSKTSFSRTNPKTLSVRQIILRKTRIAYQMKCVKRWEETAKAGEVFTLTEGSGGSADRGDGETEKEIKGQRKKGAKDNRSKGKVNGRAEGEERGKLVLKEVMGTDDKTAKVRRGQKSKDKRREQRERQRCINETKEKARMDMEKRNEVKEDGTVRKISEEMLSEDCCVETHSGEMDERKKNNELTDGGMRNTPPGAEEAREDSAEKLPDVRDGEGPRKTEQQKASDSDDTQNSAGEICKEMEDTTKIGISCAEPSVMVLDSQAPARYSTDSQAPFRGKGKRLRNHLYQRRRGLQGERKSMGEAVIVPVCLPHELRTHGGLRRTADSWSKGERGHKETDMAGQDEKDGVYRTWRDQEKKFREPWKIDTERGCGKSRRAWQRGNQFRIFSKRQRYNWSEPHPSETSGDWRNREEKGVEN